jgi:hypothetical protein
MIIGRTAYGKLLDVHISASRELEREREPYIAEDDERIDLCFDATKRMRTK